MSAAVVVVPVPEVLAIGVAGTRGIGALDLWERVVPTLSGSEAIDLGVRHHVYELQIGARHLGW